MAYMVKIKKSKTLSITKYNLFLFNSEIKQSQIAKLFLRYITSISNYKIYCKFLY